MIAAGAKAIPEGGYYSMPRLYGDGFMILGDSGGFLNGARLKGIHLAIKSGILAAETAFAALLDEDYSSTQLQQYEALFEASWAKEELWTQRNFHQAFDNGQLAGTDQRGPGHGHRRPRIRRHRTSWKAKPATSGWSASSATSAPSDPHPPAKVKYDGTYTFDKVTNVYNGGVLHEENQPRASADHRHRGLHHALHGGVRKPLLPLLSGAGLRAAADRGRPRQGAVPQLHELLPLQDVRHHGSLPGDHLGAAGGRGRAGLQEVVSSARSSASVPQGHGIDTVETSLETPTHAENATSTPCYALIAAHATYLTMATQPIRVTRSLDRIAALQENVEKVIRGKSEVVQFCIAALLAKGHILLEDVPGVGKTTLAHALARSLSLVVPAHPVHQRPAAGGHRRRDDLQPGRAGVRVRLRAGLHERAARGRDQPRHAEVAVGAARGDERGDDHDREAAPGAARSVPRHRHAEPDRARRDVSAAGVAARPFPDEADDRLSERERREAAPPLRRRRRTRSNISSRCSTATKCASCRRACTTCT